LAKSARQQNKSARREQISLQIRFNLGISQSGAHLQTGAKHRQKENSREKLVAKLHLRPNHENVERLAAKGQGIEGKDGKQTAQSTD
jgi:hypothetical protein